MLKQKPLNMNGKRSINLVIDGMLSLMKKRPFKEITISELTKEAGVVRATFYAHFESKEDVLSYYIYCLFAEKFQELMTESSDKKLSVARMYFVIWKEHIDLLKLMEHNKLLFLLNDFNGHIEHFCYEDQWFENETCTMSPKAAEYSTSIYASVLATILIRWIRTGMEESPEELEGIFNELIVLPV